GALGEEEVVLARGWAGRKCRGVSPLPGHLLAGPGHAGHLIAVALLALACLGILASLVIRPPRTVPAATWRLAIGLSLMFVLAPATRFGYFLYPAGLLAWLGISWLGQANPGGGSARAAEATPPAAHPPADQASPPAG